MELLVDTVPHISETEFTDKGLSGLYRIIAGCADAIGYALEKKDAEEVD